MIRLRADLQAEYDRPINLQAVRECRIALQAVMRDNPRLAMETSQGRLARWLEGAEAMRKLESDSEGAATTIAVRLTPAMLGVLDAEVRRIEVNLPGTPVSRSMALRSILARLVNEQAKPAPVEATTDPKPTRAKSSKPASRASRAPGSAHADLRSELQSIIGSGVQQKAIADAAGVDKAALSRFIKDANRGLADDTADRLWRYVKKANR